MAYINIKLLESKKITFVDYFLLQCCKQMKFEDVSESLVELARLCNTDEMEPLLELEQQGLVVFVKGKAKDNMFQRARLSAKGSEWMDLFETPEITEEDIVIWDWLVLKYKEKDKKIGNSKKGKLWLANFRVQSGIDRNKLSLLCDTFIKDESRMEWSFQLDYIFFKPSSLFSVNFQLEDSKLWSYYQDHKEFFDKRFATMDAKELEKIDG